MDTLFNTLKVGFEIENREDKNSPWLTVTVVSIDGDNVTFQNDEVGEIDTDREEVDEGVYFRLK